MPRRLIFTLAVAIFGNVLFAQSASKSPDNSDKTTKPPGNCTVSGRVISAADGTPVRSAQVALVQASVDKHPLVYTITADSNGHFELKQVEAGRYEFFASHTGYVEQQYKARGTDDDEGATLSLISGQEITDVLFRLVRAGVITGKVVDDTGEPMMGVNVSVLQKPSEEESDDDSPRRSKVEMTMVSAGQTDDRGVYRIFNLKPGDYYVKAADTAERWDMTGTTDSANNWWVRQETGSLFAPIYYPGVLRLDQAQAITMRAGDEMQADFGMRRIKLTEVSGRVIGADGSPATRAHVDLSVPDVSDWSEGLGAAVDDKGEFCIKGVPPGTYILSASQRDQGHDYFAQQKLDVGEQKIGSIVIAVGRGTKLHGRIIAAGGGTVTLDHVALDLAAISEDEQAGFSRAEAKKDGSFEFEGVADGAYMLRTYSLGQGWFVKSAHLGNEDVLQNGVQVENGSAKGNLEIVISNNGAQIEGAVTDGDQNQPVAGVQVMARPDPRTDYNRFLSREASTDQNGHFLLTDVPPGKYKVSAKIPAAAGAPAVKSDPVSITLSEREHHALDFKLYIPKSE